jgi:hypothetical protein
MVNRNNAGKLLLFPAPTPAPGSPAENLGHRILAAKGNLISALEFLRIAYNEMLSGMPVKSVDEVLARVEAILGNDADAPTYSLVADRSRPNSALGLPPALSKRDRPLLAGSLSQTYRLARKSWVQGCL